MNDREADLRQARIDNLTNAFFMITSGDEILESLKSVPTENLDFLGMACATIVAGRSEEE
jgi:hypothetical protein